MRCLMTAYLGRDTVCGLPVSVARAGVGVSRSPWCLSGDTLDSDHGHSCLHHHLPAEIQIITCVLMWVVVLICGQSHWSMKGTAAIAHGIAHVFQDEDGEGARGRDELLWMCQRRCVENSLFTAAAISLCYFWVFQINKNVPYPYSMPNNAFMSVIQPFDCLLLHWLPQKHKKNKINIMFHCELYRPDSSSGPVSDPGDEPRRWWKVDGDKLACFVGEKCKIHPSPSACWQNRKQGWVMVCTFPLAVWSALTSADFKETVYDIQKQRKCLFRCSQRMNPDDFGDLLTFQLATPRHWVTLTSAYEHWHWLLACYC